VTTAVLAPLGIKSVSAEKVLENAIGPTS